MDIVRTLKLLVLAIMSIFAVSALILQIPKTYIAHLSYQEHKEWVKQERARNLAVIEAAGRSPAPAPTAQQVRVRYIQNELEKKRQQMMVETAAELAAARKKLAEQQAFLAGSDARMAEINRRFDKTGASFVPNIKPKPLYSEKRSQVTYKCTTPGGSTEFREVPCSVPSGENR